ncbi:hypothetical protein KC19_5G130000 [Ceratodon purpureus]|uniref:Uncharacterized protein n=1 Tax=Ceratodon purpureus TaxID=3225 RepID=A0A8T0I0V6_CERPU|nr:hypothetical protein KC19_N026400 [Ceratodon purpureus]KAG0577092.1 hypothetical protein KC19_5G130000 [Ceratodon purpureus]
MAAADRESDERHQSRSLERDRGRRHRRHRSHSPSPPKQGRKHSRSPSVEEYRHKNLAGGAEKHARKGDRDGSRGQELSHRTTEGKLEREGVLEDRDVGSLKARKGSLEDDREDDRVGARKSSKSSKDDRKVERHSGVTSDEFSEDSDSEDSDTDRGRKRRSRAKSHKHRSEKKSKSKHRAVRSESEQDESQTEGTSGESSEDSEDEYRRAKRRKRLKQKEKDERERKEERRRKKEKKRKLKEKEREQEKKKKKKEKVEKRAKGPITESWGKYGIIKELDMWTRRPEFSAWLAEVKKVNLETLTNREEKDMFKQYMEDYNTATFPSKKYYNIDIYHRRKVTKQRLKGMKDAMAKQTERTEFNDEEQRRQELIAERAKQKETELDKIKRTMMETGMGKAMREQAVLREEMQYHYRIGNKEAAEKIQRRLEPDVPGALY